MVQSIFLSVFKISVTASVAAILLIFVRCILGNKLPKAFSYALWAIVLMRLIIPFSIPSNFSIFNAIPVPKTITIQNSQYNYTENNFQKVVYGDDIVAENTGNNLEIANRNSTISPAPPKVTLSPGQGFLNAIPWLWLLGVTALLIFSIVAYIIILNRLKDAVLYKNSPLILHCRGRVKLKRDIKLYTSDRVHTPVVCGILKPRVVLPLDTVNNYSQLELDHIITHELVHIKRFDYILKPILMLTLCIHWFNPIIWLCFILSQKDMEMSCDARVLSMSNSDARSEYAKTLINMAARQNIMFNGGLLAFGENDIKSRIKGIMKFKKTKGWLGIAAVFLFITLGLSLLTNGINNNISKAGNNAARITVKDEDLNNILMHRSKYIGDASNVSNLLNKLPYGHRKSGISLKTDKRPYGITINYTLEEIDKIENVKTVLIDNALILFSLIENVETVDFNILSADKYQFQIARGEMQKYFQKGLWTYSKDKKAFGEFLMDISFDILVYPEKYSPLMSSVPGMQIDVSLNAAYYNSDFSIKYSTDKDFLRTWDIASSKVSEGSKVIELPHGPIYWSPYDTTGSSKGDEEYITIIVLDKSGNEIIEKQLTIINDGNLTYRAKLSHDVSLIR